MPGMRHAKEPPIRHGFSFHQFKAQDDETGTFEGYLAVVGNTDLGNDIIDPGSMDKTLAELKAQQRTRANTPSGRYLLPIFWAHDDSQPIGGVVDAHIDPHGLWVKGELDLDTEMGRRARSGLARGYIPGLSIGYFPVKYKFDRTGTRHLTEISIFECTVTAIPMNPEAVITQVKDASDATGNGQPPTNREEAAMPPATDTQARKALDFTAAYQQMSASDALQDEWGDSFQALVNALYSVMCTGNMPGDSGAQDAAETILSQFSDAMSDLVARSLAAQFTPVLDDDGDSFLDPDGPNASDGDGDDAYYMARDTRGAQVKRGAVMSASNHKAFGGMLTDMKKSLGAMSASHKALTAFHAKLEPGAAANTATDDTTPSSDDTAGKSLHAGSTSTDTRTDTDTGTGAGHSHSSLSDTTPLTADQISRMIRERMMVARLAASVATRSE